MRKGQVENIVGRKFGRLTIKEYIGQTKHRRSSWLCVCDCGKETTVDRCRLTSGNTTSCGCYNTEILSLPKGENLKNRLFHNYQQNAIRKELDITITSQEFHEMTQRNCFYCGTPPSQVFRCKNMDGEIFYNGIDRIDSKKGYTKDNTVTCCRSCNYAKNIMSYDEFMNWIHRISDHILSKEVLLATLKI